MGTINGFSGSQSNISAILDTRLGGYVLAAGLALLFPVLRVVLDKYVFMVRLPISAFIRAYP